MQNQILVVEPDPAVRELLSEMVTEVGYAPVLCSRAAEACSFVHRMQIAGLIVDVWFNGDHEDSVDRTRLLSVAEERGLPIIAMSTTADPFHMALNSGETFICHPVVMPFDLEVFLETVRQKLDGSTSLRRSTLPPERSDGCDVVATADQC